ncbi:phospholipase D family protein [Jhaorihella thermophila]|uniref:phospholipase D family protein n=1 Tax=Jhaorihella thermophila TaxID=488547 RepID=UPI00135A5D7F|nr:phospholipase D family protein [Jhaorihella thermophila]
MIALLAITAFFGGCAPDLDAIRKDPSFTSTDTGGTWLARRVEALGIPHDGRGGFYLLDDGAEALAIRLGLAERAQRTIDAQYYLLHDDAAGHLFTESLLEAADRGVRVRLLIDDMDTAQYDAMMVALDRHPNFEIRLFNPFSRALKLVSSAFDFRRVNRRMHNKSMTFDNVVTIVGGRNIGDEYFAAREDSNYDDLDVLGAGPVARDVSENFDEFWNSRFAVPVAAIVRDKDKQLSYDEARRILKKLAEEARKGPYGTALQGRFAHRFERRDFRLTWAPYKVVSDPPEKAGGQTDDGRSILADVLAPYIRQARKELIVVSAYFVPRRRGVQYLTALADRGLRVVVLTNSLESTDVAPVHAHYSHARRALLEGGVELWELRPDKDRPDRSLLKLGQSQSSLHAKAFVIDRRYMFIGSFNWDPRSVRMNGEMGILIDSPAMAEPAVRHFEAGLADGAYRLKLDENGQVT